VAQEKKGRARHEVSSGGVVYHRAPSGIEVALIKAGGRWSFPKGNVEAGESAEAAALREISEETGLPLTRLRIISPLPDVEYGFRWAGVLVFKTVHNYLVELTRDAAFKPQLSEIEEVGWFKPDAARRAISFKNAKETLDAAVAAVDQLEQAS
jgi:8-oxo-dGTP pyrophosphatase MutT (NUDIX family)